VKLWHSINKQFELNHIWDFIPSLTAEIERFAFKIFNKLLSVYLLVYHVYLAFM
jgi:hypothetical protein